MIKDSKRKPYSLGEAYLIYVKGIRTAKFMRREKKKGTLEAKLIERIMLAVTEVNGCEMCSYAHTRMALEQGMKIEEIQSMLKGEYANIPAEEIEAIMFAQHYADSRGNPSKESWDHIVEKYGKDLAYGILGTIRIIMIGNVYGIPFGSFRNRFKKNNKKSCGLIYEILMILSVLVYTPFVLLHVIISTLFMIPILKF